MGRGHGRLRDVVFRHEGIHAGKIPLPGAGLVTQCMVSSLLGSLLLSHGFPSPLLAPCDGLILREGKG